MDRREILKWAGTEGTLFALGCATENLAPALRRDRMAGTGKDVAPETLSPAAIASDELEPLPLDLRQVPLSFGGSYLTLTVDELESPDLPLRLCTVRKTAATYRYQTGAWSHDLMSFGMNGVQPQQQGCSVTGTSSGVVLRGSEFLAHLEFVDPNTIAVTVSSGALRMSVPRSFSWHVAQPGGVRGFDGPSGYSISVNVSEPAHFEHLKDQDRETFVVTAGLQGGHALLVLNALVEEPPQERRPDPGSGSLHRWMSFCPTFAADDTDAKRRATRVAWFLFWNLQVAPSAGYSRTAILSSKLSLSQVWSWDNLFNAMAVVKADFVLAWDQLTLILAHQLPNGMLPDTVNDDRATYGFTKPPLWGWTVLRLLHHTPEAKGPRLVGEIYPAIARFHRWWFVERDVRGDGVPAYLSGNDSGWDNSTIFAEGAPVQSPDLLALLILDAEALAFMAKLLGKTSESETWTRNAADLLVRFHQTFVREDHLVYYAQTTSGWQPRTSSSLLTRIPILLGERLSAPVRGNIVKELRDPRLFAAPCGPSSEALNSPLYESNGYWRGPVWGPSTFLITEGLHEAGETELATSLAERYRTACAREATFRENYDAVTGAGQFDSGMTWSAADYLLLGERNSRTLGSSGSKGAHEQSPS